MIELGIEPGIGRMARLAGRRESRLGVVRAQSALEVFLVAAETGHGHGVVLAQRSTFVTVVAGSRGMRARERKPVHVLINLGNGDLPPADAMAVLAGGAHAALVDVGVATGALIANIGEHHFGMTTGAGDAFVHAAQRKARLAVIKLRYRTDRLPAIDGVAVLAG